MSCRYQSFLVTAMFALAIITVSTPVTYAKQTQRPGVETKWFKLRLSPRTPDQIAAFYEARGFPSAAIMELRQVCFITVGFKNKSKDIIWFDLANWKISSSSGTLLRYQREHWNNVWDKIGLAQRFRSTFRWTLMPETLDFRPDESEGGNIILARTSQPILITGWLTLGDKAQGKRIEFAIPNVRCADRPVE